MPSRLTTEKAAVNQGGLVSEPDVASLSAVKRTCWPLQQVSKQTWAEAAAVKSIRIQRGLEEKLSGLMWDRSG